MYLFVQHGMYKSVNAEEEIDWLNKEIRQLHNINKEMIKIRWRTVKNLKPKLKLKTKRQQTEVNLALNTDDLVKLSEKVEFLESKIKYTALVNTKLCKFSAPQIVHY